MPIDVIVDRVTNVDLGDCRVSSVSGDFNKWKNKHFVTQIGLKLSDIASPQYKLFYANFCSGIVPSFEIHVAVVIMNKQ